MKFRGQTFKNVHDVRKVYLEMTLCVLMCFVEFYVLVFDEIDVRDPKLVYKNIWVGNVRPNIPKDQPRVFEDGPIIWAKTAKKQSHLRGTTYAP